MRIFQLKNENSRYNLTLLINLGKKSDRMLINLVTLK